MASVNLSRCKVLIKTLRPLQNPKAFFLSLSIFVATGGVVALGCGWNGFENSIRFAYYGTTTRDLSSLPPFASESLARKARAQSKRKLELERGSAPISWRQQAAEVDALWDAAQAAAETGDLAKSRHFLTAYVAQSTPSQWKGAGNQPNIYRERRNSALDKLDAFKALDDGSAMSTLIEYLKARDVYDQSANDDNAKSGADTLGVPQNEEKKAFGCNAENTRQSGGRDWISEVESCLLKVARDPNLADNAAYLRAVIAYRERRGKNEPIETFEAVAANYPRSEKRAAALFMAGRAAMESSSTYTGGATATSADPCIESQRDENWARARRNFSRVIREHPRHSLASDARGWLAYLNMRVGDKTGALAEYYRLLGNVDDPNGQEIAVSSLRLVRGRVDDVDMHRLELELEDEPEAALAYAYHTIYNYVPSYYLRIPDVADSNPYESDKYSSEQYRWSDHKESTLRQRSERTELLRIADFSTRMMKRHPHTSVGAAFAVRVAGINLELGQPKLALEVARRALASGPNSDERAKALWLMGAAQHGLNDSAASRQSLTKLVNNYPDSELVEGARRLLALTAEASGDLEGALEQYLELGYESDIAYFMDVMMTPDELASFVSKHGSSRRRDEILYALGLRFMRAGRYPEARRAFERVLTTADSYDLTSSNYRWTSEDGSTPHPKFNIRHEFWEEYGEGDGEYINKSDAGQGSNRDTRVYADWLMRDLQTLDELERLQAVIDRATDDETKAEAMYQLASYFYQGNMLFYNPAAWRGMRTELLKSLDETNYLSPNEGERIWRYMQEHDAAARALSAYLEVVRLFPRTPAAADSFYTAVHCHNRLSTYNGYWSARYEEGLHAGARMVTLADVKRAYPRYRLPRADGKWEPSTRTVSGKPAWPTPPPPKQLTEMERARLKIKTVERRASKAWDLFGEIAGGRAKKWTVVMLRWSLIAFVCALMAIVFRLTRRSRAVLFELMSRVIERRRSSPTPQIMPTQSSSFGAREPFTLGGRLRTLSSEMWTGLWQVMLDERGRAALALNFVTHGVLTLLLYALLWVARMG